MNIFRRGYMYFAEAICNYCRGCMHFAEAIYNFAEAICSFRENIDQLSPVKAGAGTELGIFALAVSEFSATKTINFTVFTDIVKWSHE